MNTRIKQLRLQLGSSGEKFGQSLGVKRSAISDIETGRNNLTDIMIKLDICLTYNVNEEWLCKVAVKCSIMISLILWERKYNLSDLAVNILKEYIKLSDDNKLIIDNFIANGFTTFRHWWNIFFLIVWI